jgi:hypothetical protein
MSGTIPIITFYLFKHQDGELVLVDCHGQQAKLSEDTLAQLRKRMKTFADHAEEIFMDNSVSSLP